MTRARFSAAALALVTTGAAALFVTLAPAQAAAPSGAIAPAVAATPATVTAVGNVATLTVNPTTGLAATGAEIEVKGNGFADSDAYGMYIAVCAGTENSATALNSCVGGPVQGATPPSEAWTHVEGDWGGSFDVKLVLPSVTQGSPNCVTGPCSLFAVSDSATNPVEIKPVALTFAAAPPSSSSTSSSPTAPGTAIPQQIGSPSIVSGGTQLVVFSGFRAGEQVNLTLFSDPITLSPVTADQTGVARAEFVIPADFAAGTHRLEAIGQESGTVGVASFQVTAPVVSSSPTPSPTPSPSPSPTPSPSSTASSSAPASSAVTSSSAAPTPAGNDSGNSLWWLWLIIGIVVVAGIITAIVVYRRNQEAQREQDEQDITAAAAAQQSAAGGQAAGDQYGSDAPTVFLPPVPPAGGPPPGADPYGLLSGRDHPDNPSLYSGQDPAGPTEVLGGPGGPGGPGSYGQPLGYGGPQQGYSQPPGYSGPQAPGPGGPTGPPTQQIPPAGSSPAPGGPGSADGPGTQAWTPDFDDTDAGNEGGGTEDQGGSTSEDGPRGGRR